MVGDLRKEFIRDGSASAVIQRRTNAVDEITRAAYNKWLAAAFPSGLALLAVGGYGRRELFPCSDVDLLLLVAEEPRAAAAREALSMFSRELWDSRLRVSQSVRTINDCCEVHGDNIELSISLLDRFRLCGDESLVLKLEERFPRFLRAERDALGRHLVRLANNRHARFSSTIHHLEPNIKEAPGGFRDLHLLHWMDRLRGRQPAEHLPSARAFLGMLRCHLHFAVGRDMNVLTFEQQDLAAEQAYFGLATPEALMREYYRHARDIWRAVGRLWEELDMNSGNLLQQFRDWRSRLSNAEFTVSRERIYLKSPQQVDRDPDLVLRLFLFVARHGVKPSPETLQRIAAARPTVKWPLLRELLDLPHAVTALREMIECGLWQKMIGEWERIECLVVRDFYHRYTVDEHTLIALEALHGLTSTDNPAHRRFADLLAEVEEPAVLRFALLMHDIGKGGGEGEHVSQALAIAGPIMERLEMPALARETVLFLIERHLDLSAAIQSRDLSELTTARWIAGRTGTVERLRMLALLTYADISAVNPNAMTPWRLDQLWRVYLAGYHQFTRELIGERIHLPEGDAERQAFLEGLPTRYVRTHGPEQIDQHLALERQSRQTGVAVSIRKGAGVYEMDIVARDRLFLFASLAGALSSYGMNILKAEAFANARGQVLDTFVFADPQRTLELNPSELDDLEYHLERVALGKLQVKELLARRAAPKPPTRKARITPKVTFDQEASDTATLVEIIAQDRPGLLYDLASAFSGAGCNIDVVLIHTEAHKAIDSFYVTLDGAKISPPTQEFLRARLTAACKPPEK